LVKKQARGHLVLIGGAEDKFGDKRILLEFFRLSGGKEARIVVLPTASRSTALGNLYKTIFTEWGADCTVMSIDNRSEADNAQKAVQVREANGIFLTGGDQLKITSLLGGTRVASALCRAFFVRGATVGGTSAGAAAMSAHMIISGSRGSIPRRGMVEMAPGLGLLSGMIVDQHFSQRERIGRLLSAVARNPALLGIGIDENTAAHVSPDRMLSVFGNGTVTLVDASKMQYTNVYQLTNPRPVVLANVTLHVLADGFRYDIRRRKTVLPETAEKLEEQPIRRVLHRL
jgi:cyanophycinase